MIWVYRILFLPVFALSIPYFLWHAKRRGGYKKDLNYKFGDVPELGIPQSKRKRIWIQAVSVGEVNALRPLIESLSKDPQIELVLTTTTSTGYRIAKETYQELVLGVFYFPIDFTSFSRKAWDRIQPDLCLLMEGELWPEHIHRAKKRQVPILLINARLSDNTYRLYQRLGRLTRHLFESLDMVVASSKENAERFVSLGTQTDKTLSIGNLKCDAPPPEELSDDDKSNLLVELGLSAKTTTNAPIILCGASTWSGEEKTLAHICEKMQAEGHDLRLLITPRHVERRKEIEASLENRHLSMHFRSKGTASNEVQLVIADTTGELTKFIQLADLVFIGRSLPPHTGGQTPIEAGMLGKPILFGPGMANFKDISKSLVASGIANQVKDKDELEQAIRTFCSNPPSGTDLALNTEDWLKTNQGASQRTIDVLKKFL